MTDVDKIAYTATRCEEPDTAILTNCLSLATEIASNKVFPFGADDKTKERVLSRYQFVICEIAAYLADKNGAYGETTHNENSVERTYETGGVPNSIMKKLVPFCGGIV